MTVAKQVLASYKLIETQKVITHVHSRKPL